MQIINAIIAIMNIDYIKTFLAVYRAGSFVEAAKEQDLAPSSVSRSVAALEDTLKTRLFQRTTRSLTPTQAGEAYFEKVEPLIEEIDWLNQSLIDATSKPSGRLRITTSVSYGQIVLAPKIAAFREQYPDIQLELVLSDGRIDIINNQIDVAIRHGSLPDSSLISRKLKDVKYRLVASEKYLEQSAVPTKPLDLQHHELITFAYDDFRHNWTFEKRGNSQAISVKPVLTATNAAAIRQCVREGLGIALLADWTVLDDLQSGRLVEILTDWNISGANTDTAIWLVYPSNRFTPAKTRALTEFLVKS